MPPLKLFAIALALQGLLAYESLTTEQGLPSNVITEIVSDSRGYLWLGTADGVSRYDGERLVTYTVDDGLPHPFISTVEEDHAGAIWVATGRGVAKLDPSSRRFTRVSDRKANDLAEDAAHRMWSGCGDDLCYAAGNALQVDPSFRAAGGRDPRILVASPGVLWAGGSTGLLRRVEERWSRYGVSAGVREDFVEGLLVDPDGTAWISTGFGVYITGPDVWKRNDLPLAKRITRTVTPGHALQMPRGEEVVFLAPPPGRALMFARSAFRARDGVVWIPGGLGVLRIANGFVSVLDRSVALPDGEIYAAGEDAAGNLWLGTAAGGAVRIPLLGITRFTRETGLAHPSVQQIFEDANGRLCAVTGHEFLNCLGDDGVFRWARVIPPNVNYKGWGWENIFASGQWVATGEGLLRWPAFHSIDELARAKPLSLDRTFNEGVFRVWTDSRGALWISGFGKRVLVRRDGNIDTDFPVSSAPTAFTEDQHGVVWIGFYTGGVGRVVNGRIEMFGAKQAVPAGFINDLFTDSRGRIWIATANGASRIDDPSAARIAAKRVTGLAMQRATCIGEARDGRIVIGSNRGIALVDATSGEVTNLASHDGLSQNGVGVVHRDRHGVLWLGSIDGLWRMERPPARAALVPLAPRFDRIDIGGAPLPIPELGVQTIDGIRLTYPDRRMTLSFSAPHFSSGGAPRLEYRLDGDATWSDASDRRSVTYESLSFGEHRFEVRARNATGRVSLPATVSFHVIPPLWRRTWVQLLGVAIIASLALLGHQLRVRHILALHEVRDRVATDLHDDLGSSLSRISLLTEVAKTEQDDALLDEIGETARDLVDSLGDSIWAIDPKRDDVRSLLSRVRHFAAGLLEAKSIAMEFRVADDAAARPLGPECRRDVYLVLKEALHNAARHSGAKSVAVTAGVEGHRLRIAVTDDGRGFDERALTPREDGGRGLASMRERAARAGGTLTIATEPGLGTRIEISVPL